jgi:hypothetical protein
MSAIEPFTKPATNVILPTLRNNTRIDFMKERRTATRRTIQVRRAQGLLYHLQSVKWDNMLKLMFPEDERTIANKLAREEKREHEGEEKSLEQKQREADPTLPVSFSHLG